MFAVADDENCALCIGAGTDAGGEFVGQLPDDGPLVGAGVLGLVHQNMVDAAIEPEQDPSGDLFVGQKQFGFHDQVVEIEQSHINFALLVGG